MNGASRMSVVATDTAKELPAAYFKRRMHSRAILLESRPARFSDSTGLASVGPLPLKPIKR
jgi:hypothetical protein